MKKLHFVIASAALLVAVAVGYSATKSPMQTPKAQDCCAGGCPCGDCCADGSCCR